MASTFAFTPSQPYQDSGGLSGNTSRPSVSGGDSQGGVVRASPLTMPDGNDGIPEFLAKAMEPYVAQKQQEAVVKGFTDAQAGKTIQDVSKHDKLGGIFGPSSYHTGAAAFTASTSYDKMQTDLINDPSKTQGMNTDQLGTFLTGQYKGLQTGDRAADAMVNQKIIAGHGPLVDTLTKYAYRYGQQVKLAAHAGAASSAADSFQATSTAQASMGTTASPDDQANLAASRANFLGQYVMPADMAHDTYQSFLTSSAKHLVESGNYYGYHALQGAGLLSSGGPLTDDQIDKVHVAYDKGTSDIFAQVAHDPDVNKATAILDSDIRFGRVKTPKEIFDRVEVLNNMVAGKTGIQDKSFVSGANIATMQKDLSEGQFSAGLRLESHQWEQEAQAARFKHEDDVKAQEIAMKIETASKYVAAGTVASGIGTGLVDGKDANLVFGRMLASGNFGALTSNFQTGKYVNEYAASQLQGPIANSVGIGPTTGFKASYGQWQKINAINPGAAYAYYGDQAAKMIGYDAAIKAGETDLSAYAQTFGKPPELGRVDLPEGVKRADAVKAVNSAITSKDKWGFGLLGQRVPMASSSAAFVSATILPIAASDARASGLPIDQTATHIYNAKIASGELERAGPFAWSNAQGTQKLSALIGLPDDATDQLVTQVADKKLKAAGFSDGAGSDNYSVLRVHDANDNPALYIMAYHSDHTGHTDTMISLDELKGQNVRARTEATTHTIKVGKPTSSLAMPAMR